MRLLSPYARYSIQLIEAGEHIMQDPAGYAVQVPVRKGVVAYFDKLGLMDHEQDLALSKFDFSGLPEGVHPLTRVGVWDSEAYCLLNYPDPDERAVMQDKIDKRARELQPQFPNQFIIAEPLVAAKPWGSYDEDSTEDILRIQERVQIDPKLVREYEQENQQREEIIDAMLALEPSGPVPPEQPIEVNA